MQLDKPVKIFICKDGTFTYGTKSFNGHALPVHSVDTEDEAKSLQILFCKKQYANHPQMPGKPWYVLNRFSGNVEDLPKVGDLIAAAHERILARRAA